jgi:hypothetical protein
MGSARAHGSAKAWIRGRLLWWWCFRWLGPQSANHPGNLSTPLAGRVPVEKCLCLDESTRRVAEHQPGLEHREIGLGPE